MQKRPCQNLLKKPKLLKDGSQKKCFQLSEKQVVIIYAATHGYLDEINIDEIKRFEKEFLEYLEVKNPKLMPNLAEKKEIDDKIEEELKSAIDSFVSGFKQEAN